MDDASTLCRRCGLCCDGSLFTAVPLAADEVAAARSGGLVVIARADGSAALRQPCVALGADGCGVYAARPGRCRRYRCMLLTAMADGEVALADALVVVDEARARVGAAVGGRAEGLQRARGGENVPAEVGAALAFVGRHFERAAGRG